MLKDDDTALDFKWPEKGDRLLKQERDWAIGAVFESHIDARSYFIEEGYKLAASILIDHCYSIERNPIKDKLIYPIFFCYRHGLEVVMKGIIQKYGSYASINISDCQSHDLWKLWNSCKTIMIEICGNDEGGEEIKSVEQVIKDFHDSDPRAVSLRYATSKKGAANNTLPNMMLDLKHTKEVMEGIFNFLECSDCHMHELVSSAPTETGY